ncbi:MAG: hypothetical protein A2Y14_01380 [Verrucomicrobia bacterium GWF2_51_19]|nr:MAG: hypothetical protein A2Y14_01380 [Verrucomicrobia bacterium GWF2_51_19]HCJ11724.1 hydroxyacid dehydrogenase [Opitutae bacterium]
MRVVVGASSFAATSDKPIERLRQYGIECVKNPFGRKLTESETIEFLKGADGVLAGLEPYNATVLKSTSSLKAISRIGIGLDNVDIACAKSCGIRVSNTPEGPTKAVAEMTLAALLCLARGLVPANQALHEKKWNKAIGLSIDGLTVLVIGYGRIGRQVGTLLKTLGANILIYDPQLPNLSLPTLAEGLIQADVITIHASGNTPILTNETIKRVKTGAILLNAARGELVDEVALIEALNRGKVAACWLDVFAKEPYDGPLTQCSNALLTPHISTYTKQCRDAMETQAVENLLRDLGLTEFQQSL